MTQNTAYRESLEKMFALRRFGIKLELDTIRRMLANLGNPQERFACIHVAGTNGKGSIAAALASILSACGLKTGLYTSPHLVKFNERICIDNRPIDDDQVVAAYRSVEESVRGLEREPTFFEYSTAMALYEFAFQKVAWGVIETGMGGRMDATNVIAPQLSIISNISLEHQMYLGATLAQIAFEKAGIIKPRTPVVTGVRQKKGLAVIAQTAQEKKAPLYRFRDAFRVRHDKNGGFTYSGIDQTWPHLSTPLKGDHQNENAALVLAACELLARQGLDLSLDVIRRGLAQTRWPGRLEIVSNSPLVILDGAHNLAAARSLGRYLEERLPGHPITLVVGILDDKPYAGMLNALVPLCRKVILTRAKIDRALDPQHLVPACHTFTTNIKIIPDVVEALKCALSEAGPGDAVCVAGSLYVVGEAKAAIESQKLFASK